MNHFKKVKIGIIGCGNISQAYFNAAKKFEILELHSCADLNPNSAKLKAEENGCLSQTVSELLSDELVDLVINLTIPSAHAEVSLAALNAGKHVHSEKPLAVLLEDGKKIIDTAKEKGLLIGCAPDTFLGGGLQTCRKIIDDGWIGKPVSGTAFLMSRGPESWHPNPSFFYLKGAGPMFDMGPYYITALVHLLGPIASVCANTSKAFSERIATCKEKFGLILPVEIPTHYSGSLIFHSGAVITVTISFDVHAHKHTPIEIYGTNGSIVVPDPNTFGGPVMLFTPNKENEWKEIPFSHPYIDNMRSIGAADLAYAIRGKRPHRANGEVAYHVLEVMHAFQKSFDSGRSIEIEIESFPPQPSPLPIGLIEGYLDIQ